MKDGIEVRSNGILIRRHTSRLGDTTFHVRGGREYRPHRKLEDARTAADKIIIFAFDEEGGGYTTVDGYGAFRRLYTFTPQGQELRIAVYHGNDGTVEHRTSRREHRSAPWHQAGAQSYIQALLDEVDVRLRKFIGLRASPTRVFIAGPTGGIKDLNVPAFNAAQKWLEEEHNLEVRNPAAWPPGWSYEEYLAIDLAILGCCDGIVFLPGSKTSPGALRERAEAEHLSIPDVSHLLGTKR